MSDAGPATDAHALQVYARDSDAYDGVALLPAEHELLRRLRPRWSQLEMLDIGVGSGRTTMTFGAVAGSYLGIDFSRVMIDRCRARVPSWEGVELGQADARSLRRLGRRFDVVLFSLNGIDTLGTDDRRRVLEEVFAVLRPSGTFMFSSHVLTGLPLTVPPPGTRAWRSAWLVRHPVRAARLTAFNRQLDLGALRAAGCAVLHDGTHGFDLPMHYVTAAFGERQLREIGFVDVEILNASGRVVPAQSPGSDISLHYLCRRRARPAA